MDDAEFQLEDIVILPKTNANNDSQLDGESENVNIDKVIKTNECKDVECWGCKYSFGIRSTPLTEKLELIYRLQVDKVSEDELASEISKSQIQLFCLPGLNSTPSLTMKPWTKDSVLTHLKYHMIDSIFNDVKLIKRLRTIEDEVVNCVVIQNRDGLKSVKDKAVAALEKIVNMRVSAESRLAKHKN